MSSNITKDKISESALQIFVKKGFAGTSISQIAKKTGINPSLIYHHFKSKEDLWSCVKKYCVDEATQNIPSIRHDTLENFVYDLVEARFSVYEKPSIRMLIHWQSLESDTTQFYGSSGIPHPMFDIANHVQALQKKKMIRSDQDYQVLSGIIFSLASYTFFDFANAFNLSDNQKKYHKTIVCNILNQTLKQNNN